MALLQWNKHAFNSSLFIACIFLVLLIKYFLRNSTSKKLNLPPSPRKLPIIGNLHQISNATHLSLRSLAEKYGPIFYLQLGQLPSVVVSSPGLAKEIMKTHDLVTCSRPIVFSAKHLLYNCTDIAFSPYGAYWRDIRKICTLELFSAKRVQSFNFIRQQEVARLVQRISGSSYPGTTNLTKLLGMYANEALFRMALGRDFLGEGDYDRHGFQSMLEEFQVLLGGFSFSEFFPSVEFIHSLTRMKSKLELNFKRFDKFFDEVINEHLKNHIGANKHKDLVDVLLDIQKGESSEISLTMDNVKAIMLDMFAAGTDTTFITLDWAMTELLMNPRVMQKAQAEVRSIVEDRKVVQESDLPHLHYMKDVIKEVLRLHPPAPVSVPRECMEDITIDGYDIPAKTRIYVNTWAIGRDPLTWENPEIFEPERFIDSSIDYKGQDFELIPFGAGRRKCPAITFAETNVELALAQLLHTFDWQLPPGEDLDMTEVFGITMHRIENLIVIAKPHFL